MFEDQKQPKAIETVDFDSNKDYLSEQVKDERYQEHEVSNDTEQNTVSSKPLEIPHDMESLTTKLEPFFHSQDDPELQRNKETFLKNINEGCEELLSVIKDYPDRFDLLFYLASDRNLSIEEMKTLASNFRTHETERLANKEEVNIRVETNPVATEDEYRLGTYVESLETQVREAVGVFLHKGYRPVESGFLDPIEGSQYIGFSVSKGMDRTILLNSLTDSTTGEARVPLDQKLKHVFIQDIDDGERIQLVVVPKEPTLSQGEWEDVWNQLATFAPPVSEDRSEAVINNGFQGTRFREEQEKLRIAK